MKFVFGFIIIAMGAFMVIKTDWMMKVFGRNDWAEQKLGPGGSWQFYKMLGIIFIFLALFIMSGIMNNILDFIFIH